jgi:chorismate mutase
MYFSVLGDESIYEAVDELLEKVRENNQFYV